MQRILSNQHTWRTATAGAGASQSRAGAFSFETQDGDSFLQSFAKNTAVSMLWLFFIVGAFLHQTGEYATLRESLHAPILIFTSLVLAFTAIARGVVPILVLTWVLSAAVIGFFLEVAGVATGIIFGPFYYGDMLGPKVMDVPLTMGFAWAKVAIYAVALSYLRISNVWLGALVGAFSIMCYVVIVEPAAVALGYWTWMTPTPPFQNYLVWLLAVFALTLFPLHARLFRRPFPRWVFHLLLAEQVYFLIVGLT